MKLKCYCEECNTEYSVHYKGKTPPTNCPWCQSEIDLNWNADVNELEDED